MGCFGMREGGKEEKVEFLVGDMDRNQHLLHCTVMMKNGRIGCSTLC